jgi:glycine cleavage system regulatory protein
LKTTLVFTFIGDDRPGLVESISRIVSDHEGNWLESRLSQLAGKFAGIIQVEANESSVENLSSALHGLERMGLSVVVERVADATNNDSTATTVSAPGTDAAAQTQTLTLLGLDRPGIVRDVSRALASQNINVLALDTKVVKAAMTGEPMFDARAIVAYATDTDHVKLAEELDAISADLGVDIEFE